MHAVASMDQQSDRTGRANVSERRGYVVIHLAAIGAKLRSTPYTSVGRTINPHYPAHTSFK